MNVWDKIAKSPLSDIPLYLIPEVQNGISVRQIKDNFDRRLKTAFKPIAKLIKATEL